MTLDMVGWRGLSGAGGGGTPYDDTEIRTELETAAEGAAEALARPEIVDIPPTIPTAPFLNVAFSQQTVGGSVTRNPLATGYQPLVDARAFGMTVRAFDDAATPAQAVANRIALQDAVDWSHETGGTISHPGGRMDVSGTVIERTGMAISAAAASSAQIRQVLQPTDLTEPWRNLFDVEPVVNGATKADDRGGVGYVTLTNLHLHGGWDMTSYAGAPEGWWQFDPDRMTQRAFVWDTPTRGPWDGSAGRAAGTDAHNWLIGCLISHWAGYGGHVSGRGENRIVGNTFQKCAINNLYLASPDCWVSDNSMSETGSSGTVVRAGAGDLRFSRNKM